MTSIGKNILRTEQFLDYVNNMQEIDEAILLSDSKMLDQMLGDNFMGCIKLETSYEHLKPLTSIFIVEETQVKLFQKVTNNIFLDGYWHKRIIYSKCI